MMLLLVVLLGMYLRGLRTANVYGLLSSPLFRKEGARGRFNYCNLFKINLPNPSLQKRGFFYDIAFSDFIRNIFERVKNGERLWAIKLPLFRKEGAGGRFNYFNLSKTNFPIISICAFSAFNAGI